MQISDQHRCFPHRRPQPSCLQPYRPVRAFRLLSSRAPSTGVSSDACCNPSVDGRLRLSRRQSASDKDLSEAFQVRDQQTRRNTVPENPTASPPRSLFFFSYSNNWSLTIAKTKTHLNLSRLIRGGLFESRYLIQ